MKKTDLLGDFLLFQPMHKLHPASRTFEINSHVASVSHHYADKQLE